MSSIHIVAEISHLKKAQMMMAHCRLRKAEREDITSQQVYFTFDKRGHLKRDFSSLGVLMTGLGKTSLNAAGFLDEERANQ